jgi:hypothetical protein
MVSLRRRPAVSTGDTRALRRVALRTSGVRFLLVASALALLAAAFAFTRGLEEQRSGLVPPGSSTVLVLDVSLSISEADFRRSRRLVERLVGSRTPVGLVVFSDVPYELLPPGTPARELRPMLRFLTPTGSHLPPNPWTNSFSQGTRISASLDLAEEMLRRDRIKKGSILLASDLQTAPTDYGDLGRTLARLRRSGITVRALPLSASSDGITLFERLLGQDAFLPSIEPSRGPVPQIKSSLHGKTPVGILVAGSLLFLILALHERFAGRLTLPRAKRSGRRSLFARPVTSVSQQASTELGS